MRAHDVDRELPFDRPEPLAYEKIESYEGNTPVLSSYFIINEAFNQPLIPDVRALKSFKPNREALLDALYQVHDDLSAAGCYAGAAEHKIYFAPDSAGDRSSTRAGQIYLYMPHIRPVKVYDFVPHLRPAKVCEKIKFESNADGVERFVANLARKGFIDLQRDEAEIVKAFGLRAHIQATIMTARAQPSAPFPAV